jgi:benzodiazapine receptor
MNRNVLRQSFNVLAVLATIVVNGLANALPLNGQTTGSISDRFHVYFVPAGYVFAIWGLIYLGFILFAVYQALPGQRENPRLARIGYLFVLSCIANIAWLFLWHYERFTLTWVAMLVLLASLIAIYLRIGIGRLVVPGAQKWFVDIPFSIYLGWISVATIANVTSVLDFVHWGGWGLSAEAWAVIMLVAGTAIAAAVSLTRGDVAYMLVIVWAFVGIAVKQAGTPLVATSAWVAAGIAAVVMVAGALLNRRRALASAHAG